MRELSPKDIEQRRARIEVMEALDSAASQGSQLMVLAEKSETVEDFRAAIEDWLGCSPIAARAVGELQIRRMPRVERQKMTEELQQLRRELADHNGT